MFTNRCRVAASAIAPLSYICLVSGMVPLGALLNLVGQALIVPFAVKNRAWDMVALTVFFTAVNTLTLVPHAIRMTQLQDLPAAARMEGVNLLEESNDLPQPRRRSHQGSR